MLLADGRSSLLTVSAIVEREQRKGIASPILHVNEGNRIWIRSNLRKNLEPVFSKIGLEKDEIQVIVARHQDEVRQYLKAHEPKTAKLLSGLTKSYQKALGKSAGCDQALGWCAIYFSSAHSR